MVFSCKAFTNTILHQTGKRGQYIDRRIYGLAVKLTVKNDLSFSDITGQVRNGMCNIIIWHGQDRDLCNRACTATDNTGTLIKSSQLAVQISRISFTGGDFSFGGGNLTHCLTEGSDICKDYKDMHSLFKGKIFCCCQCDLRGKQTLHCRIVCKIQKHNYMVRCTAFFKGPAEELSYIVFNAHGCKNNGEVLVRVTTKGSLTHDLGCQLVMGKSVA